MAQNSNSETRKSPEKVANNCPKAANTVREKKRSVALRVRRPVSVENRLRRTADLSHIEYNHWLATTTRNVKKRINSEFEIFSNIFTKVRVYYF